MWIEILKGVLSVVISVGVGLLIAPWVGYAVGAYFEWCEKKRLEWKCRRKK